MSYEIFLVYSVTIFIASIMPGPSMLLALNHGMKYGAKRTIASALGNLSITLLQATFSIAGLGAILLASEGIFTLIKWIGAAYLIYMGGSIWFSPNTTVSGKPATRFSSKTPLGKMYLQAAIVTAGNPKAIVFFTAVFPQFINPDAAYTPQLGMLLVVGAIISFGCFMIYAIGGQKVVSLFSKAIVGKYFNKMIGTTFIGAGIGLATSNK